MITSRTAISRLIAAGLYTNRATAGNVLRAAARHGRIEGARLVDGGWEFDEAGFDAWVARMTADKRGRPRNGTALTAEQRNTLQELVAWLGNGVTASQLGVRPESLSRITRTGKASADVRREIDRLGAKLKGV